jgi:hypothetical protein
MSLLHYRGGHLPDETSFNDTTVCPNNSTYAANKQLDIAFEQMLVTPNPPSQWKPRNTPQLIGALHNNP